MIVSEVSGTSYVHIYKRPYIVLQNLSFSIDYTEFKTKDRLMLSRS